MQTFNPRKAFNLRYFPQLVPMRMLWDPIYTGSFVYTAANAAAASLGGLVVLFRLNSIFDPLVAATLGQESVVGLPFMKTLYKQYRVYACRMTATWHPTVNTAAGWLNPQMFITTSSEWTQGSVVSGDWTNSDIYYLKGTGGLAGFRGITPQLRRLIMSRQSVVFPGYNKQKAIDTPGKLMARAQRGTRMSMSWKIPSLTRTKLGIAQWKADDGYTSAIDANPADLYSRIAAVTVLNEDPGIIGEFMPAGNLVVRMQYKVELFNRAAIALGAHPVDDDLMAEPVDGGDEGVQVPLV